MSQSITRWTHFAWGPCATCQPNISLWLCIIAYPARTKQSVPAISSPNLFALVCLQNCTYCAHGPVPCLIIELGWTPSFPSAINSRLSGLPTPSLHPQTKHCNTRRVPSVHFPAKRTSHDQCKENCSTRKEVAEDGSPWEEAAGHETIKRSQRMLASSGRQGALRCVHRRWEAVRGAIGVPWHDSLQ
uniref:Uncharacterized protein n=1 Tax=Arundo donax TaxID=35708 RepID=A0A0A9C8Q5_ARUDO